MFFNKKILLFLFFSFCSAIKSNEYILMDDQIESFINEVVYKVKDAIKYEDDIKVYISSSQVLNAAALQDGSIVINAGSIFQCKNVGELIAILAHEVGHISGKHITSYISSTPDFMRAGLITILIGAAAAVLAKDESPLFAGLFGGQSMSQGMALSKLRQKENMADSKAIEAIRYLNIPVASGFLSIQERLGSGLGVYNAYLSTHPQPIDRISKARKFYEEQKNKEFPAENIKLVEIWQKKFESIKLKLKGLLWDTSIVLKTYKSPKNDDEKFAKAIAYYRSNKYEKSIELLDELIEKHKDNNNKDYDISYYAEIKCMSLINIKKCKESVEIAWNILKNNNNISKIHRDLSIIYADAIVEGYNNDRKHIEQAIKLLKKITILYKGELSAINLLGKLYTLIGKNNHASLCSAEIASIIGDKKMAVYHAKKAYESKDRVVRQKANDILTSEEFLRERKG